MALRGRRTFLTAAKTAHKKEAFLRAYKKLGGKALASEAIGVDRDTVWKWEQNDEKFRADVIKVEEYDTDQMEKEMRRRAMKKSDLLMMFAMKKRKPEYRDSSRLEVNGSLEIKVVDFAKAVHKDKP